jgi:hypothetical protein
LGCRDGFLRGIKKEIWIKMKKRMKFALGLLVLFAALSAGGAFAADPFERSTREGWFRAEDQGPSVGYAHDVDGNGYLVQAVL